MDGVRLGTVSVSRTREIEIEIEMAFPKVGSNPPILNNK